MIPWSLWKVSKQICWYSRLWSQPVIAKLMRFSLMHDAWHRENTEEMEWLITEKPKINNALQKGRQAPRPLLWYFDWSFMTLYGVKLCFLKMTGQGPEPNKLLLPTRAKITSWILTELGCLWLNYLKMWLCQHTKINMEGEVPPNCDLFTSKLSQTPARKFLFRGKMTFLECSTCFLGN